MIYRTTSRFWNTFEKLPPDIQQTARKAYKLWQQSLPIYFVRIGLGWRVFRIREGDCIIWFWIGSHADYDKLISQI